jgi:hypothetical protein
MTNESYVRVGEPPQDVRDEASQESQEEPVERVEPVEATEPVAEDEAEEVREADEAEEVREADEAEEVREGEPSGAMKPGDIQAEPEGIVWAEETAQGFQDRWREVQLRFVDDPRSAVDEAKALAAEVVEALTTTLARRRDDLDGWGAADASDTEQLRVALRGYRDFLGRVLGV